MAMLHLLGNSKAFLLQLAVVVSWTCRSAEGFRRRAQCLTWIENLALLYRAILPIPVWYKFFEDSGMGMILCAMTTGGCMISEGRGVSGMHISICLVVCW